MRKSVMKEMKFIEIIHTHGNVFCVFHNKEYHIRMPFRCYDLVYPIISRTKLIQ